MERFKISLLPLKSLPSQKKTTHLLFEIKKKKKLHIIHRCKYYIHGGGEKHRFRAKLLAKNLLR